MKVKRKRGESRSGEERERERTWTAEPKLNWHTGATGYGIVEGRLTRLLMHYHLAIKVAVQGWLTTSTAIFFSGRRYFVLAKSPAALHLFTSDVSSTPNSSIELGGAATISYAGDSKSELLFLPDVTEMRLCKLAYVCACVFICARL